MLGMGSILSRREYRGLLGSRGELFPYQRIGGAGSFLCPKSIHEGPGRSVNPDLIRQSECGSPYKQDGRHEIPGFDCSNKENLGMVSRKEATAVSPVYSGQIEFNSRFPVKIPQRQDRLDTESGHLCCSQQALGTTASGLICQPVFGTAPEILQLEGRSGCRSNRCIQSTVVPYTGVCTSPMVSAVASSTQGLNGESNIGCGSSPMENTGMVSSNYGDVNGSPNSPSRNGQHCNSISELQMPSSNGHSKVGRMEGLRRQFKERAIPEKAGELILASWRHKTNSNYNSSWRKWEEWCEPRDIHPFSSDISGVLGFLADQFEAGRQYWSLNCYRSAISSCHLPIDGF